MKAPAALQPLMDDGVIDEVVRSLKSGEEAALVLEIARELREPVDIGTYWCRFPWQDSRS
jgi:hypothetical protein